MELGLAKPHLDAVVLGPGPRPWTRWPERRPRVSHGAGGNVISSTYGRRVGSGLAVFGGFDGWVVEGVGSQTSCMPTAVAWFTDAGGAAPSVGPHRSSGRSPRRTGPLPSDRWTWRLSLSWTRAAARRQGVGSTSSGRSSLAAVPTAATPSSPKSIPVRPLHCK